MVWRDLAITLFGIASAICLGVRHTPLGGSHDGLDMGKEYLQKIYKLR